jgi:Reverse transcriptase (RNA-dependent DNA polymerase)
MIKEGYLQSNVDHTMFIQRKGGKLCVLIVYVDDIVLTGNDTVEMKRIKGSLATEFEMKDLDPLRYFLSIEVVNAPNGVFLSQQKYVLELLHETEMLGCRPANTPIDPNHELKGGISDQVDRERYKGLWGDSFIFHTLDRTLVTQ